MSADSQSGDLRALEAALRGVRTVICTGRLGHLLPLCQRKRIDHLIVLTSAGQPIYSPLACCCSAGAQSIRRLRTSGTGHHSVSRLLQPGNMSLPLKMP